MTDKPSGDTFDGRERRCPRLGGPVTFGYCRSQGEIHGICPKIFDCWWERFDVTAHLGALLPAAVFEAVRNAVPPPKMTTILDLIQKAKASRPID